MILSNLTIEKLKNPLAVKQIQDKAAELVLYNEPLEGYRLLRALDKRLEELNFRNIEPDIYAEYGKIFFKLKFLAFSILTEEESILFVNENLGALLSDNNLDLNEKIKARIFGYFEYQQNLYKGSILKILKQSRVMTGRKTISDWLLNYDSVRGGKKHDKVARTEYMIRNKDAQSISEQDKMLLRKVLTLYDEMKPEPL